MYAIVRRYRMAAGAMDDLMHKIDTQFTDWLQEQLGILHYQAIDTGDGSIVTVTMFEDEDQCRRSEAAGVCGRAWPSSGSRRSTPSQARR